MVHESRQGVHKPRGWRDRLFPDITYVPQSFRDKHWGVNGSCDWGEPAWPGWRGPPAFWDSRAPVVIILAIGVSGPVALLLFAVMPVFK